MVTLSIKADFGDVERRLKALQEDVRSKALASAVNKTLAIAQTAMNRGIRAEFNLTAAKVREKLAIKRARFARGSFEIEGVLFSRGRDGKRRAINLINFGARATKGGLSVKIKREGGRKVVKGGFIGNKGRTAFIRTGKKRLPIKALQTIDVPQMFNTKRINAKVVQIIRDRFPDITQREVNFYTARFNRGAR